MIRVLLTSTSFQDTPGRHHDLLSETGFEVTRLRGPLSKEEMLQHVEQFDALLCGDDHIDQEVIDRGREGRLKVISKYGVGLDKLDANYARAIGIPTTNCPGVNHTTVAEHVFALLLGYNRNIHKHSEETFNNQWKRYTGHEIMGCSIGIMGFGSIGRAVADRANAFGCTVWAYDPYISQIDEEIPVHLCHSINELLRACDVITLHLPLNESTRGMVDRQFLERMKAGSLLINTSRGEIIDNDEVVKALDSGHLRGYLCDVLEKEPMIPNHPLAHRKDVIITPHIGSRTHQSVVRQGCMAVENLIDSLKKLGYLVP